MHDRQMDNEGNSMWMLTNKASHRNLWAAPVGHRLGQQVGRVDQAHPEAFAVLGASHAVREARQLVNEDFPSARLSDAGREISCSLCVVLRLAAAVDATESDSCIRDAVAVLGAGHAVTEARQLVNEDLLSRACEAQDRFACSLRLETGSCSQSGSIRKLHPEAAAILWSKSWHQGSLEAD